MRLDDPIAQSGLGLTTPGGMTPPPALVDPARPRAPTEPSGRRPDPLGNGDSVELSAAARRAARRPNELTEEEQQVVEELQARDREVRAHEQAHKAAAGELAVSGPSYDYQRGPDGRQYAIGGHVDIRIPEGRTPEEKLRLAQKAEAAATAPAEPSSQDRRVAARAAAQASEAEREIRDHRLADRSGPIATTTRDDADQSGPRHDGAARSIDLLV
ncbi:MAG: putative metalloprotease CJM1_0395 family protein [Planctomycetota bacterium]